jgi:hypothetical protein
LRRSELGYFENFPHSKGWERISIKNIKMLNVLNGFENKLAFKANTYYYNNKSNFIQNSLIKTLTHYLIMNHA